MAATSLNLLTAALSQSGLPTDSLSATGTAAQTGTVTGLFQSILASAVSQATTTAVTTQATATTTTSSLVADQTSGLITDQTGTLSQLLGLIQDAANTDANTADGTTGLNADLLSQLLAALGVNLQQFQTPPTATNATPTTATSITAQSTQPTTVTVNASISPLPNPNAAAVTPANPLTTPATTTPATPVTNPPPTSAPTSVPLPANPTDAAAAVAQTVTVANANQVGGRLPAVVLQTPVAVDPGYRPPTAVVPVGGDDVPAPVSGLTAVKGLAPVAPGSSTAVTGNQPSEQQVAVISTAPAAGPATTPFAVPGATTAQPVPVQPGVPTGQTNPGGTTPANGTGATAGPVSQPTATGLPAASPVTTGTPQAATAAPVRGVNPDIAITVAQPIDLTAAGGDPGQRTGLPGFLPLPARAEDSKPSDTQSVFGPAAGTPVANASPATIAPADQASAPTPKVADQLADPIVAHLRTRGSADETELRIRLDPPELGAVKLKIVSTGGDVRAELHVSSDAVRRVVESQLPELRQKLDDAGVKVQRFDVTADPQGGTARDDRGDRWRPPPVDLPPAPAARARPTAAVSPTAAGRVDVSV